MLRRSLAAACFALAVLAVASVADISGKWTATFGKAEYSYTFKQDGTRLTGTITSEGKDTPLTEGEVQGDNIVFAEIHATEGGRPRRFDYSGKIISADEIRFRRRVLDYGLKDEFTAKRVK